jgi:ubiquinone/menaquinone biosynthesis C-methylase UbiE
MNSATYFSHIKESPEEWEKYHTIADQYDARDKPEHSPYHRTATFIHSQGYPAGTPVVDLGCGRDRLRDDERVSHLDWTSVDAVPASERVVQADLGNLPMADNTVKLAVISRALWARKPDHLRQLREAERILQQGGILVLCESRRKWIEEDTLESDSENPRTVMVNNLENAVKSVGFAVIARSKEDDASVWQFLVCQKPIVGGI